MARETNETLTKLLRGYQLVSEGEIMLNRDWQAYEIKFQGGGTSGTGEKLVVWGRRLFIPAARPGVRNGFEITMLAHHSPTKSKASMTSGSKANAPRSFISFESS